MVSKISWENLCFKLWGIPGYTVSFWRQSSQSTRTIHSDLQENSSFADCARLNLNTRSRYTSTWSRWKQGQATKECYKNMVCVCRKITVKSRVCPEFISAEMRRETRGNSTGLLPAKVKTSQTIAQCLHRILLYENLLPFFFLSYKSNRKHGALKVFFASLFIEIDVSQIS